ncbi:MAG: UDP-N-acetylmuramoyl-L-alanine--D-glutamate ligase [Brockia lithotrophica]|nr:UDP-N-acetylmuramoyl-L-alanine--D-glutamate ligase [Brockia lithotrophica]
MTRSPAESVASPHDRGWTALRRRYAGRRVLVLGGGRSGVAAALLLVRVGARVTVSDVRGRPEFADLERAKVPVRIGPQGPELLAGAEVVVKSPGLPPEHPAVRAARERGIPVVSEVGLSLPFLPHPRVAVTGSNGKTTVVLWTRHILAAAGLEVAAAGNVGVPLSGLVGELSPRARLIVELSSFQLEDMRLAGEAFRAEVAVLTNLYPHHVDYHGSPAAYARAKAHLFSAQGPGDVAVVRDAPETLALLEGHRGRRLLVGFRRPDSPWAAFVRADGEPYLALAFGAAVHPLLPVRALPLPGEHNAENALFAAAAAYLLGAGTDAVVEGLRTFPGVPHRLEYVGDFSGVHVYNDSKATNPEAAAVALAALAGRPTVLLAGGLERGESLSPLAPYFAGRAGNLRALVAYGEMGPRLAQAAREAGLGSVHLVRTLAEAVGRARELVRPGDVLLLSPAAASWDQYPNFEARGEEFRRLVREEFAAPSGP